MSFKAANIPKRLITGFKSGNNAGRLKSSRILLGKSRYFISKPNNKIYALNNNKIKAKFNTLRWAFKPQLFHGNRSLVICANGSFGKALFCSNSQHEILSKNDGISVGNKFIAIENPQNDIISINVKSSKVTLIWDEKNEKYHLHDLKSVAPGKTSTEDWRVNTGFGMILVLISGIVLGGFGIYFMIAVAIGNAFGRR